MSLSATGKMPARDRELWDRAIPAAKTKARSRRDRNNETPALRRGFVADQQPAAPDAPVTGPNPIT